MLVSHLGSVLDTECLNESAAFLEPAGQRFDGFSGILGVLAVSETTQP